MGYGTEGQRISRSTDLGKGREVDSHQTASKNEFQINIYKEINKKSVNK
jgi:hypothetical protein